MLDYLRGIRFEAKKHEKRLKERIEDLTFIKKELDSLIQKIEDTQDYDIEKAKKLITEFRLIVKRRGDKDE